VDGEGAIDKKKIADIIFEDDEMRKAFEGIIHPLVMDKVRARIAASDAEVAVVEVPMLFEGGHESGFDKVIAVYADENVALDRLTMAGIPREDIVRRLMCQMPIAEKISRSDFAIDNNGTPEEVKPKVRQIMRALKAEASG
jgi:dephospho-CoA kinase